MLVALCKDWYPDYPAEFKDFIDRSSGESWRWNEAVKYCLDHPEYEITDDYHDGRYFRIGSRYICLEDVDNSRLWTILDYDGSEYVQYLDYDRIDDKSNYCKFKE